MRKSNRVFLVFGALIAASVAAVHCGGDDAATPGGGSGHAGSTGTAGSTAGTAGTATGAGGTATGAGGTAGSAAGAGGAGGATAGAGGTTAGSGGIAIGDSGLKDVAVLEAGACPLTPPAEDSACAMQQICTYPTADCRCAKNKGADAGRAWTCISPGDGGAVADAEACPATPVDGDACTAKGQHCPIGDAGASCVCAKNVWNCP